MYPHQMRGSQGSRAILPQTRPWNPLNERTPTGSNPTIGTNTAMAYNPKAYPPGYPCSMYPSSNIPQKNPCSAPISNCAVMPSGPNSHDIASPMYPYSSNSMSQLDIPCPPNRTCPPNSSFPLNSQYPVSSQSLLTSQHTQGLTYTNAQCAAGTACSVPAYSRGSQCFQSKPSCMKMPRVSSTMPVTGWDPYQQKGTCSPSYQMPKRSAQDTPGLEIPPAKKVCHDKNGQPYSVQLNGIQEGMRIQGQCYLTVTSTPESQCDMSARNQLSSAQKYNTANKLVPPQFVQGHLAMSVTPVLLSPQREAGIQEWPKGSDEKTYHRLVFSAVSLALKYLPKLIPAIRNLRLKHNVVCLSPPVIKHLLSIVKPVEEIKLLKVYFQNKLALCRIVNGGKDCPICQRYTRSDQYLRIRNKSESPTNMSSKPVFPVPSESPSVHRVTSGRSHLSALETTVSTVGKPDHVTGYKPNMPCSTYAAPPQASADTNAIAYAKSEDRGHSDSPDISSTFLSESEFRDQPFDSSKKVTVDPCRDDSQNSEWGYPQKCSQNLPIANLNSFESSVAGTQSFVPPVNDSQSSLVTSVNPLQNSVLSTPNFISPMNHFQRSPATNLSLPQNSVPSTQRFIPPVNRLQPSPAIDLSPPHNSVPSTQRFIPPVNRLQPSPAIDLSPPHNSVPCTQRFIPPKNHLQHSSATDLSPPHNSVPSTQRFILPKNHLQHSPATDLSPAHNSVPSIQRFIPPKNHLQHSPATDLSPPQNSVPNTQRFIPPKNHLQHSPATDLSPPQNSVPNTQRFIPPMNHLQHSPATDLSLPQNSVPCMQSIRSAVNHVQRPPVSNVIPQDSFAPNTERFLSPQSQFPSLRCALNCSAPSVPSTRPAPRMSSVTNVTTKKGISSAAKPMRHSGEAINPEQEIKYSQANVGTAFRKTSDKAFRQQAASLMKLPETIGDQKPVLHESGTFSCFALKPSDRNKTPPREQVSEPLPKELSPGMLLPHRIQAECIVIDESDDDEPVGAVENLGVKENPTLPRTRTITVDNSEAGKDDSSRQAETGSDACTDNTSGQPVSAGSQTCTGKTSGKVLSTDTQPCADNTAGQVVSQDSSQRMSAFSGESADNTSGEVVTRSSKASTENAASGEKDLAAQFCQNSCLSPVNQDSAIANSENTADNSDNCLQTVEGSGTVPLSEALKQLDNTSIDSLLAEGEAAFATFVFNEGTGDLEITTAEFGDVEWKELMRG
ncbi:uncharacterized protein LOC135472400 [Liolophura sinensis]|uniref:uncharacterized protein LOC135472400 n=1 Tax=Liolophura sinensis TaxID=3198878 RepID=UPI0031582CB5